MVPTDDGVRAPQRTRAASQEGSRAGSPDSIGETSVASGYAAADTHQQRGERSSSRSEGAVELAQTEGSTDAGTESAAALGGTDAEHASSQANDAGVLKSNSSNKIGKNPGEVAFFKLLHAEFKKAEHFFEKAQQEFIIREERVREGMDIIKQPNSIMVNEKWSLLAKSLYRLYKDLLLLETFAIMTYCAFSKILKKHDKVTGYNTRSAFMANVVSKANFTTYPAVLQMIERCEHSYEEVSENLIKEGKHDLYEDERLFINMIHRLNEQVLDTAESEGVQRNDSRRSSVASRVAAVPASAPLSRETTSLRSLVESNELRPGTVSEGQEEKDRKRKAVDVVPVEKRQR